MARLRRRWILAPLFAAALTLPIGIWTARAHGTGNPDGNNIEFGRIGVADEDTARKVTPRQITIKRGQTVTFHINGGHQPVVLRPGVPLEALGSEGVNLDGTGPQTPLPPDVFGDNPAMITAGLSPRFGPGRWDANPISCGGAGNTELTNTDRPQVFDKMDCPTPRTATTPTDWTTIAFQDVGRYAFMCNFPVHYWDEGIQVTGPANDRT